MKYYNSLTNLESEIIRLDMVTSMMNILANGAPYSDGTDLQNAIWFMQEVLEDIRDKSTEKFETLFDQIRQDTWHKQQSDPVDCEGLAKDECNELTEIVNNWVSNQ